MIMRPLAAALVAAGCSFLSAKPDRTQFFVLDVGPSAERTQPAPEPVLGLGPITMPSYLDRPELVTRTGSNQLQVSPTDRWGEPLELGFARALRFQLGKQLGADSIVLFPWDRAKTPPLTVAIDVSRFERRADGTVELRARWTLRESASGRILSAHDEEIHEPAGDGSANQAVYSLSRSLAILGVRIARAALPQVGNR
jgi:uncharacterized lipoprotein YmbA